MAVENILRFLKNSIAHDLGIISDSAGDYALGVAVRHELTPVHASKTGVQVGLTELIHNITVSGDKRIRKIVCTGDTDAFFKLKIDGNIVSFGKITPTDRVFIEEFAGGFLFVPDTKTIELSVENTGLITSDYEAIIYFGE